MIQLTILFKFYLEQLKSAYRSYINKKLLAQGYTLYNTRGRNTIKLNSSGDQVNSSGRIKPCRMHDINWVIYDASKHNIRKTWPRK